MLNISVNRNLISLIIYLQVIRLKKKSYLRWNLKKYLLTILLLLVKKYCLVRAKVVDCSRWLPLLAEARQSNSEAFTNSPPTI